MPMARQYEQLCNAAALEKMGVKVIRSLHKKYLQVIREWVNSDERIKVSYPDVTESLVACILDQHWIHHSSRFKYPEIDAALF